jgi:hypothetical protein
MTQKAVPYLAFALIAQLVGCACPSNVSSADWLFTRAGIVKKVFRQPGRTNPWDKAQILESMGLEMGSAISAVRAACVKLSDQNEGVRLAVEKEQLLALTLINTEKIQHEWNYYFHFDDSMRLDRVTVIDSNLVEPTRPNQPPQRNAGSRPSSDDAQASETPSSLGPRG